MRTPIITIPSHEGDTITLAGWVDTRRDHGKIIFIDLRDRTGMVQVVVDPSLEGADGLRTENVVELTGIVKARPAKLVNDKVPNKLGAYEVEATVITILNTTEMLPLAVTTDGYEIGEETRMRYRYLDLRRPRLQHNLTMRHRIIKHIRDELDRQSFIEVETPNLTKSTPEGARDYLVPARLQPGQFYALPQSPQQFKQLLMVAGIERYFQIARCFRDEDTRGDRQAEFTQLDLEMSFVERDDVMALNESLLISIVTTLFPDKRIQEVPFPRITYAEAMEQYGSDRPDLRTDPSDPDLLAFCWVVDFPFFEKTDAGTWTFTHNPFSAPKAEHMGDLLAGAQIGKILTTQYDVVLNGYEIGGGSIRNHTPDALRAVFRIMGFTDERIDSNFGHMLQALGYGAPPHGGIAWGLDRLVMLLCGEPNIREVMAFPKTGDGRDLMMDAPAAVTREQLQALHLKLIEKQ